MKNCCIFVENKTKVMKNIHVLATDKPSRVYKSIDDVLSFTDIEFEQSNRFNINQNIYITSDEEIKEGDWCLSKLNELVLLKKNYTNFNYKKIILTTDQDLIKDGVQAIDDEFLEWFVKNPSCEEVEVEIESKFDRVDGHYHDVWEIIIPKEEPKQKWDINTCRYWNMEIGCEREKCICENTPIEEPKQETLEEVAERLFPNKMEEYEIFLMGAKWQTERMYSEEDMRKAIDFMSYHLEYGNIVARKSDKEIEEFIEQFKKK